MLDEKISVLAKKIVRDEAQAYIEDKLSRTVAYRNRVRCCRQPLVQGSAFVGFNMGKCNITKFFGRQDTIDGLQYQGEHFSQAGVEQQRFIIRDEVLIE